MKAFKKMKLMPKGKKVHGVFWSRTGEISRSPRACWNQLRILRARLYLTASGFTMGNQFKFNLQTPQAFASTL